MIGVVRFKGKPLDEHSVEALVEARWWLFEQMSGLRPRTIQADRLCDLYGAVHEAIKRRRPPPAEARP